MVSHSNVVQQRRFGGAARALASRTNPKSSTSRGLSRFAGVNGRWADEVRAGELSPRSHLTDAPLARWAAMALCGATRRCFLFAGGDAAR